MVFSESIIILKLFTWHQVVISRIIHNVIKKKNLYAQNNTLYKYNISWFIIRYFTLHVTVILCMYVTTCKTVSLPSYPWITDFTVKCVSRRHCRTGCPSRYDSLIKVYPTRSLSFQSTNLARRNLLSGLVFRMARTWQTNRIFLTIKITRTKLNNCKPNCYHIILIIVLCRKQYNTCYFFDFTLYSRLKLYTCINYLIYRLIALYNTVCLHIILFNISEYKVWYFYYSTFLRSNWITIY